MKKLFVIILVLSLSSCFKHKEKGIDFEIKNESELTIKEIKFYTSEKTTIAEFHKIEPNESTTSFLAMKNNQSDGGYVLEFTRSDGQKEISSNGYYTNGSPLDRKISLVVKKDTILWRFNTRRY